MPQYFQIANIVLNVKVELTSSEAVKQAVMAGLGYFMQSILSIKNDLRQKDISIIPIKGLPLIENWRIIWLKQKKCRKLQRLFLKFIKDNDQSIYQKQFS